MVKKWHEKTRAERVESARAEVLRDQEYYKDNLDFIKQIAGKIEFLSTRASVYRRELAARGVDVIALTNPYENDGSVK